MKDLTVLAVVNEAWVPVAQRWLEHVRRLGVEPWLNVVCDCPSKEALWGHRLELVRQGLERGPVLLCDVDTVWQRDDREWLGALLGVADVAAMEGSKPAGRPWEPMGWTACCGYMGFAATGLARLLVADALARLRADRALRDQAVINGLLWEEGSILRALPLPVRQYHRGDAPDGAVVWHPHLRDCRSPVEVLARMTGFWEAAERC